MHINKLIFYTTFEIIALAIMLLSTFFIWNNFEMEESAEIAYSYTNKNERLVLDVNNNLSVLAPMKDKDGINEKSKVNLSIYNVSKINKRYNLYLTIDDSTTLSTKYLKISSGENPQYLFKLEKFYKDNQMYYFIKTDEIKSKENINLDLYIWLSEETPNEEQDKNLNLSFKVEEM